MRLKTSDGHSWHFLSSIIDRFKKRINRVLGVGRVQGLGHGRNGDNENI